MKRIFFKMKSCETSMKNIIATQGVIDIFHFSIYRKSNSKWND